MRLTKVTSSWIAKVGAVGPDHVVCVVTSSGKSYKISGVSESALANLADRVTRGGSIGGLVSDFFKAYSTEECTEEEVIRLCGGEAEQTADGPAPRKGIRQFADLLLPHARTGLFSWA